MHPPTATPSAHRTGLLLMLGSAACFVVNVLLIRALAGLGQGSVWVVASARFVVGLLIVAAFFRRECRPVRLLTNRRLVERGLLGGACILVYYHTVTVLGAGRATFINNTYVVWGALMAVWALREKLRPALTVGAGVTLGGLALLTNPLAGAAGGTAPTDLLALANAFVSAWIVVTIRQLHATEHSATIFAAQCAYGLLICGGPALSSLGDTSVRTWMVLGIAGLCSGVGQLMMTRAYRELSVAEGSLLQMVVPLGIALGGAVFFHEHFSTLEMLGGALILAGSAAPAFAADRPGTPETR